MMRAIAGVLIGLGGFVCCLNFCLSFIRYPVHRLTGGIKEDFKWSSGIPLIGSLFVAISLCKFWQTPWILPVAIILIVIDTGGIHWYAGTVFYYEVLKKGKSSNNPDAGDGK